MGDPRAGVGIKDGLPEIDWLPVAPGGDIEIAGQTFTVKPFYIARYLVTHTQYQAFVEADDGFENPAWWQGMPEPFQCQSLAEQHTKRQNHPRDSISWYQSVAFTRWLHHRLQGRELTHPAGDGVMTVGDNAQVRLPTEWEWQWASQNGAETRPYPWGERRFGFANTLESGLGRTVAVGMYPHGAAVCGALDMAGMLEEWCANNKQDMPIVDAGSTAAKLLRGGDFAYDISNAACTYRDDDTPTRVDVLNGFRLALG